MLGKLRQIILITVLLMTLYLPIPAAASGAGYVYPSFSIQSVVANSSVTIRTYNFPAGDSFDVRMGEMGTRGVGGYWVTSIGSGAGGSFTATFPIPAALHGNYQISIRLQSNTGSGYYAFNWFYNNTTGKWSPVYNPTKPGYGYYPTFMISAVVRDSTVTIVTHNLPASDRFRVLMGPMGTAGINGYKVAAFNTGSGGTQTLTFTIPAPLYGSHRIAIRIESVTGTGYYAYNWFYNNTTY